ncbi:MAG: hypothetical protein HYY18_00015 [Planctomycetes bacterium]|nr:hypothetical protein [Planctomycetota bacterium]
MSASERARKLVDHLRARREWYGHMAELAREQRRLLEENPDGLLELLERKKAILAQLEALAAGAPAVRAEWDEIRPELSAEEAAPVEAELAEVSAVLEEVVREEEAGRKIAEAARAGAAGDIRVATDARKAAAAYRKPASTPPRFVDRKE